MKQQNYYVYLLTTNNNLTFYVGVTNDLVRRVIEHKIHCNQGFTQEYNVNKLVYFETFSNVNDAIKREKQVNRYKRLRMFNLVNSINADGVDLSEKIGITKAMVENAKACMLNTDPGTESSMTLRRDFLITRPTVYFLLPTIYYHYITPSICLMLCSSRLMRARSSGGTYAILRSLSGLLDRSRRTTFLFVSE